MVISTVVFSGCCLSSWAYLSTDPLQHVEQQRQARAAEVPIPAELPGLFSVGGNAVTNGQFMSGQTGWSSTGSVTVLSEEAILRDTTDTALLYQAVALSSGVYTISFDFSSGLDDGFAPGTFPDTFFASLYFIDDLSSFDLVGGVFDATAALMDLDFSGAFNVLGTLTASDKGPGWSRFSTDFTLNQAHVVIAFELAGINGTPDDSSVLIDNVLLAVVPEPSTWVLMAVAGVGLAALRRRRSAGV
jgi:hypothetical protein